MNTLVQQLVQNTTGVSLGAFRPELTLCATIIAMLLAKVFAPRWRNSGFHITLLGLTVALVVAVPWGAQARAPAVQLFTGMLLSDSFSAVVRSLLLIFALLFTAFTQLSNVADADDMTEFYTLVLGALLGMCLMITANHALVVLLGVEMASVPCYVLAGMRRNDSKGSEAALKYAVFGAGAAGVMLYGLSLLVGVLGSAHLPTMATQLAGLLQGGADGQTITILVLGGLMLLVGVAFKLSAVPFHFWAPDVFEGATAEVGAFLSVASKAAALGLLVRLAAAFSFHAGVGLETLAPVRHYLAAVLAVLAAVTCTFGNLAAYGQTNMKRLLAYSTIAHAGYMMMPVAAAVSLIGPDMTASRDAVASLVVYIAIYLFMNLTAFAIVAFLRNAIGSEEIADYAGLVRRSPGLTVCMALVLFSLVGLPPLSGFAAKFFILGSLVEAKMWTLLFIAVINTVFSLVYYLRVVRVMVFSPEPLYREAPTIPLGSAVGLYCEMLTFFVVGLFFLSGGLLDVAKVATFSLFGVAP